MNRAQKVILAVSGGLPLAWIISNYDRIEGDQDGVIRLVLGLVLCLLVLVRPKRQQGTAEPPAWLLPAVGVAGTLMAITGIVLDVHQVEWLGLLAICYACLRWALPPRFSRDILLGLFIAYWIHPLPWQVLGGLQLSMQRISIAGAEWALHALNQRVWADGLVLHSGFRAFGIPEACSGMRTLVTVALCLLGTGTIMRFRWYELAVFVLLGFVQVLILNVIRITSMVYLAERMPLEWSETFLHDTLGIFLLVAIVFLQLEASWWRFWRGRRTMIKEGIKCGELERPDKGTRFPSVWRFVFKWGWAVVLTVLFIGALSAAAYKRRPYHRKTMIGELADHLAERDPAAAERALLAALEFAPGDRGLISKQIGVLLRRDKHEEALSLFQHIPEELTTFETIMKSWSLMELERPEEAVALIDALPESDRNLPGVAIVRAEYGVSRDEPEVVSRNVVLAAPLHLARERVRSLFPYLARHEQWQAIVDADRDVPYARITHALVAIHANLQLGRVAGAAAAMKHAQAGWPEEPIFLRSLFALAAARPGTEWDGVFVRTLEKGLAGLSADDLATYLDYSFRLNRPDLAWQVYRRLATVDSRDPALSVSPAQYGQRWFTFRRHQIGVKAKRVEDQVDLRAAVALVGSVYPLSLVKSRIPLVDELGADGTVLSQRTFLNRALVELDRRERSGALTSRMEMAYPSLLAMTGKFGAAHARLDDLLTKYPENQRQFQLQHAGFYNREGLWDSVYETLRQSHHQEQGPSDIRASLMMINAAMNMNFGVTAFHVALQTRRSFPGSPQVGTALGALWDVFGFKDEALFALTRAGLGAELRVIPQILYDTGRFKEAERLSRALRVRLIDRRGKVPQRLRLTPAEASVTRRWPEPPDTEALERQIQERMTTLAEATSPFRRQLVELEVQWCKRRGAGESADPRLWLECGRDAAEEATALHRLTMLAASHKRYAEAALAARMAVERLPTSAQLWRVLIAVTEGDPEGVAEARKRCPDDPEIWLASLVLQEKEKGRGRWGLEEIQRAVDGDVYSVSTMVRAGHFLLRKGMTAAAAVAARDAVKRCQGLLSAYVLAMHCALRTGDLDWALSAALSAVDNAADPVPFYRSVVSIKSARKSQDADLVAALEHLRAAMPDEPVWGEHLAHVYFQKKDARRALTILTPLVESSRGKVRVQSLLLAAESARAQGNLNASVRILESAYGLYPDQVGVLNNLVYNLAQSPSTVAQARALLPKLLKLGGDRFEVYDTAATVYMKSGNLQRANEFMNKALATLDENDYSALEVKLNAARILFLSGELDRALDIVRTVRASPSCSDMVELSARDLQAKIERAKDK